MVAKGRRRYMDGLPEEVLHEVLSRVGNVKDLFMLAVTCRRWLRRFTDPAFLRGLWGVGHRARLLGFLFQQTRLLTFLPAPGSPLRALTSSLDDGTFNYAEPLAARRGIVLMKLVARTGNLLGLCNPLTGERHVLPPLECSGDDDVYTYAIITAADSDIDGTSSSSVCFAFSQLLVTTLTKDYKVNLHSYSAATRRWSAPTMCRDKITRSFLVGERSAVVHQGAAHWLWINEVENLLYTLSTEVGKHPCILTMTKLAQVRVGGSPLLCVSRDGQLLVACVHPVHVTIWTQQQGHGEEAAWVRTAVIRIPMAAPSPNREKWVDFNRGSMLVLYRGRGIFVLDLDKKVMEKIMDDCLLPRFNHLLNETTSVAYEMGLVEFFLLHLGGLCFTE